MKLKRFLISVLTLCLVGFTLSACGPGPSGDTLPPSEPESLADPGEKTDEETDAMIDEIFLTIGIHKISVALEKNPAVDALIELLKQDDIIYTASDYGGFEKVGSLGHALPRSDRQMTAEAGDVILYSGNQIVLFYGSNSWSYTKLGRIQGLSAAEWKEILTESNPVTVTIGLR